MNLRAWLDVGFCLGGVYLTLSGYGWLPLSAQQSDDDSDPDRTRRVAALKSRLRFLGPLTAILGLLRLLLERP
jgi:hypothetical protein